MSVLFMAAAFKSELPTTKKLVLLALADCANDQGECYPSVRLLEAKCSLSDRAVQKALSELEADGYLTRQMRVGRATLYTVTPERRSPPNVVHPRTTFTPPPNVVHPTPEPRSPITIREPSKNHQEKTRAPETVAVSELLAVGFDESVAVEFIAHKRRVKAPLTARAWKDHLAECRKAGWSPQQAAERVMARNWKGFDAKYVQNEKGAEPQWVTEKRDRMAAFAGPAAEKRGQHQITGDIFDAAPKFLG